MNDNPAKLTYINMHLCQGNSEFCVNVAVNSRSPVSFWGTVFVFDMYTPI